MSSVEFCLAFDDDDKKKKKDRPIVEEPPVPPTQPPTPPTPQTASLTVNKEIFGCTSFNDNVMRCSIPNNDLGWISCDNPPISITPFCTALNENSFDIEVLNSQNNQQIPQFEESPVGTTIPNLQPGTYTVNEIEIERPPGTTDPFPEQVLTESITLNFRCDVVEFPDGGYFLNSASKLLYQICFEYEDEQGNDCNTITLGAGEHRTCTVKNYINFAGPPT